MNKHTTTKNQAVLFTKPVHHLEVSLTSEELTHYTTHFLNQHNFVRTHSQSISGKQLAKRETIRKHYYMYSKASCISSPAELCIGQETQDRFQENFKTTWNEALKKGYLLGNSQLMNTHHIDTSQLFVLWNDQFQAKRVKKLQPGLLIAWIPKLKHYCINGFYPVLEEIFNSDETQISYFVIEFDPAIISWKSFRKTYLGCTDASRADKNSLRGKLYQRFGDALHYPGRDNFVHGSAGPLESFNERIIHETNFNMQTSPIGQYLLNRGVSQDQFIAWKDQQSLTRLGALFDQTEELNTQQTFSKLDKISFA